MLRVSGRRAHGAAGLVRCELGTWPGWGLLVAWCLTRVLLVRPGLRLLLWRPVLGGGVLGLRTRLWGPLVVVGAWVLLGSALGSHGAAGCRAVVHRAALDGMWSETVVDRTPLGRAALSGSVLG